MTFIKIVILSAVALFLIYKWSASKYHILRDRGIPHHKPTVGNLNMNVLLGKSSFIKFTIDNYNDFKSRKIYGIYSMRDVNIYIPDLNLNKKVSIKDFDTFPNHNSIGGGEAGGDTFLPKSLIVLKDKKWREMRNSLSPSFTGSKMRLMFQLVNECVVQALNYIDSECKIGKNNEVEIEMKDFFTRFTNDAIASTAFGIQINSFQYRNNEFYRTGKAVTEFTGLTLFKAFLFGLIPKVMKGLSIKLFDDKIFNYFNHLVFDAIKYRKVNKIIRPDMIHLLMEAKQRYEENKVSLVGVAEHVEFTDEDLLAQCTLFFVAGFETVSACLCLTAHELLENSDIQDKFYEEILETQRSLGENPLNYDILMKLKYMDMVISESLRKWPPVLLKDRICSMDYTLKDDQDNLIAEFKNDDNIFIPITDIHRDHEYYPNPDIFDPERFSDENKNKI